jgi:cellulose synthase/poly-beta-1,6-N-acetylglucosamine synthase-like glycosyltransferase
MNLCAPAWIYIAFSISQIIIDIFLGMFNTAFFKTVIMVIIAILLNWLCSSGYGIVSWIIVFIPFIFMSTIVAVLLFIFGLDPSTGKINIDNNKGGNLVYTHLSSQYYSNNKNTNINTTQPQTTSYTIAY